MLKGRFTKKKGITENNKASNVSEESVKRTRTLYALFFLVITSCLGEAFNIFGIKLSWIVAIITILFFIFENKNKKIRFSTCDIKKYVYFFIIWFGYATLQMPFILNNDYAISSYLSLIVNIFIVIILALNIHSIEDLVFINKGLIVALVIHLSIAIWEITTGNHIVDLSPEDFLFYYYKPVSVFVNGNDLATFICFGIVSLLLNYAITKANRLITFTLIIISIMVLININARAPIYGMLIYVLCFISLYILFKIYKNNKLAFKVVTSMILSFFIISIITLLASFSSEELVFKISSAGNLESDILRLNLMKAAIEGFVNSNLLGMGPGQSINLLGINVHNFFLEIMAEYGLIIFGGILMIFIQLLKVFKQKLPEFLTLCIMSFPPAFALISIASSGAVRIRATWIIITLLYFVISLYEKKKEEFIKGN
ncbi:O-antigen ligase family protein [Neobacillus sp. SCS-31]|uniref:O-antigen ligase family protein n=1 Tax=Neobacillus oceani TaxID=3115292 RepID=UPI003906429A